MFILPFYPFFCLLAFRDIARVDNGSDEVAIFIKGHGPHDLFEARVTPQRRRIRIEPDQSGALFLIFNGATQLIEGCVQIPGETFQAGQVVPVKRIPVSRDQDCPSGAAIHGFIEHTMAVGVARERPTSGGVYELHGNQVILDINIRCDS